jgi:hypothetical protein
MVMDWLEDLRCKEVRLRRRLAALRAGEADPPGPVAEECFERTVRPAIEEIQACLDDYLCGRDAEQRAWMSYEVRLNLPVFSHLRSLYSLASAADS